MRDAMHAASAGTFITDAAVIMFAAAVVFAATFGLVHELRHYGTRLQRLSDQAIADARRARKERIDALIDGADWSRWEDERCQP